MVRFGVCTEEQYFRLAQDRRIVIPHAAYNLLDVGERPTQQQVHAFEDISVLLRTSNGTFRTTFPKRFLDLDRAVLRRMQQAHRADAELHIQDRAASHALTSSEWAALVFETFPSARFEASDILLEIVEIARDGVVYIVEPNGRAIQYIKPPFVVSLEHAEPKRFPINRMVAMRARRRFERLGLGGLSGQAWMQDAESKGWRVRRIPYIHPQARELARTNPHFQVRQRTVFETIPDACDAIRTMNIFNRSYFSDDQLREGARAIFRSLHRGGIWIVGRTLESDFSNHATLLRRGETAWEVLERVGEGSEIEGLALGAGS